MDELSLSLDFKPKTLALCNERWYATGDNDAINIYDSQQGEWVKKIKTIKDTLFTACSYLCAERFGVVGFGYT